ncbi:MULTISPECIES: thioredoxin fold domain-containing protein [unclassified Polaromonas]|jgi:thiol:disulfide interchange protein DsbG|uniref:thioredoxin fold domain-containing protein n=1 Tax=unclassified Polaromonas TaxID=2638319 RepID=UPI000BDC3F8E|nr:MULTISPECIES: thioredoxin fold domain-containing protein [unclassified Polaromonas]OYY39123.1 MAG: thiol:disulfide interchange protein [Polaromonas sp. 35-63-35]OYZ21988.1 MAG: thiol:disulfide interchange protein [Polaromonas sp. 16-63-31]OYZ80424.1 MAG: thiol:disulfide interchange protein [Polaromonas sp. 24-63-21]OZA51489.1 MAG: thiol:disulfide interchange protein [Polaromonas sp. 17-63-33]OZA90041.1 MAG: thiol:disulfide interchange protein [Polaromonas sp. 39-63-25]
MTFQPFQILPAMLVTATLLLTACQDTPAPDAKAKAGTTAVSTAVVAAEAKGFSVGSTMSTRTVYVFFDPQCPHCNALWVAAKPLKSQAKFVWIPVGILNASSTAQGATLLAAKDPAAAMDEHEASMQAKGGGISAGSDIAAQKEIVAKNTALLTRLGFGSIPTIIGTHAQSGALVTQEGSMPTAALAALLGLQVPAAQ